MDDTIQHESNTSHSGSIESSSCEIELKQCTNNLNEAKERYLYLNAEFDNYRKRTDKEKVQWASSAQALVLADLLPLVDDFERALNQLKSQQLPSELETYLTGFELIAKSLYKFLKKYEIEEVEEVSTFNPELHEAIVQVQSDKHDSGSIVEVLQKGYKHKGQILRPARVSVAE